ncbi:hypothetical protein [Nocardiopsis deserti]|uniref:hypothetical protein n=1 Tax=Nocardiopsis deserti TaxID=2605988 RepID=UPI00123ACAA3|nr:hypothetical protein [Nocardiopsis deserti]
MEAKEQQQKLLEIVRIIASDAQQDWRRIKVNFSSLVEACSASLKTETANGDALNSELSLAISYA